MKRFMTLLVVSMGILCILIPVAFAGSGSPEKPEGEIPRGLSIQGDAPGEKLVGVVAMEQYGFNECTIGGKPATCANARATVRLRKSNELHTFFAHVENVVLYDFGGNQDQIMQVLKPTILNAFGMDPNSQIVVRNLEEFGDADDLYSPLAEISGGPIFNYIMDIVIAVK